MNILRSVVTSSLLLIRSKIQNGANLTNVGTYRMSAMKKIKDLGYAFNVDGQLRKLNENGQPGEEPFEFNISSDHHKCQTNYEILGEAITEHVYQLLESEVDLVKVPVPKGSSEENGTFIFVSKDYDKKDVVMILIHGSGVVRAGQWARSLIINDCLDNGTQLPYIRKALERGYGIIVLNSNDNYRQDEKIPNSGSPEAHASYVWEEYIKKTKGDIVIVAHSYGGVLTVMLADKKKDFENRVKAVALTDSVHGYSGVKTSKHLLKVSRNWIANTSPLDAHVKTPDFDITRVSAGHPKHEMTSCKCIESVFKFFEEKLKE